MVAVVAVLFPQPEKSQQPKQPDDVPNQVIAECCPASLFMVRLRTPPRSLVERWPGDRQCGGSSASIMRLCMASLLQLRGLANTSPRARFL